MARTTESSEPANTLTQQELNPLQNPLLSEHIHRWAEVYFTNPPEKRDAAVAELLAELQREHRQKEDLPRQTIPAPISQPQELSSSAEKQPEGLVTCAACGHENPVSHQFCGMCGQDVKTKRIERRETGQIAHGAESTDSREIEAAPYPSERDVAKEAMEEEAMESDPSEDIEYQDSEYREQEAQYTPPFATSDLSLFQSLRAPYDVQEEEWEYGPERSSSYRFYMAAALILIIGGLGYLAWRTTQATQATHEVSPPPPAPATESPQTPTPSSATAKPETAPAAAAKGNQPAPVSKEPAPPRNRADEVANSVVKASRTQRLAPKTAPSQTASTAGGGEELAIARGYLNGTNGRGRDGAEAAKWLWRSIAKQNGQATLMLADLYLRGDGVPKNCDQGRVLLDSAAQKGVSGAGDRLRNLQAFGCR